MQIHCEACGELIPAGNLDLDRGFAKCAACDHVFNCNAQLERVAAALLRERPEIPLPKGLHVYRRANGLRITWRWFGVKTLGLIFFACLWNAFIIFWYSMAIRKQLWSMALFGLLHAAVGIGVAYAAVAGLFNTTVITALKGMLEVRHGPIPVPGNRRLPAADIEQLYVKQHVTHSKHGTSISYEVRAQQRAGKDIKLVGGLTREDTALFIEQRLEEFLGIADQAVPGEIRST
ncbi:MAG: hypothetical protein JXR77_09325 [Lentisphaeria bacterium]|nr:hypothetical protein [Lentisphaeria bacterium]